VGRHFGGLIFMGNGRVSERACERLKVRLNDGLIILSGLQQGGDPLPGCDEPELHDIVRDVGAALLGRNVSFWPSPAYRRLIAAAREAAHIGGEASASKVIKQLREAVAAADKDYDAASEPLPYPPRVPDGCRPCNACGGEIPPEGEPDCEVCKGKGFWNVEDIREYHERYPELCRKCCGEKHVDPPLIAWDTPVGELEKRVQKAADRARLLLEDEGARLPRLCSCGGSMTRFVTNTDTFAAVLKCQSCGEEASTNA